MKCMGLYITKSICNVIKDTGKCKHKNLNYFHSKEISIPLRTSSTFILSHKIYIGLSKFSGIVPHPFITSIQQ